MKIFITRYEVFFYEVNVAIGICAKTLNTQI